MRQIKFRAWNSDEITMMFIGGFPLYHELDNGLHSGANLDSGDWVNYPLMQFTGLQDNQGADIYEGDIVSILRPKGMANYVVEIYQRGSSGFPQWQFSAIGNPASYSGSAGNHVEIIGNIHEHKHLIEVSK